MPNSWPFVILFSVNHVFHHKIIFIIPLNCLQFYNWRMNNESRDAWEMYLETTFFKCKCISSSGSCRWWKWKTKLHLRIKSMFCYWCCYLPGSWQTFMDAFKSSLTFQINGAKWKKKPWTFFNSVSSILFHDIEKS